MEKLNDVYNLTTNMPVEMKLQNKNEIEWNDIRKDVIIMRNLGENETVKEVEDFNDGKITVNPVKLNNKDGKDTYYLVDKHSEATYSYRHRILKLIEISEEMYNQRIDEEIKVKVKR